METGTVNLVAIVVPKIRKNNIIFLLLLFIALQFFHFHITFMMKAVRVIVRFPHTSYFLHCPNDGCGILAFILTSFF